MPSECEHGNPLDADCFQCIGDVEDALRARIAELENAGTVAMRLLLQGHKDEALFHLQANFKA